MAEVQISDIYVSADTYYVILSELKNIFSEQYFYPNGRKF